jgi:CelD/BcsL family acetyltransferase involved in cellulose biosynthesis
MKADVRVEPIHVDPTGSNIRSASIQVGDVKVSVARPHELGASELDRWRDIQRLDQRLDNPFLSPEFTHAVGRVRPNARVAVLQVGRQDAGYFSYEHGRLGVGRPIGAGICDCQGVVQRTEVQLDPYALLSGCKLAVWEFDHLLAHQASSEQYHTVSERSPVIDLSSGFSSYIADRPSLERQLRRSQRVLEREVGPITFDYDVRDMDSLRMLMGWKSAQYRRTGRFDRFANRSIVQVVEDLMDTRSTGCSGTLSVLYASGQPVAAHFGLRSGSVLASWFPAFDARFARYRPGLLLFRRLAEASAQLGLRQIDFGKGQEQYKQDFKNADIAVVEGWVERPTAAARWRRIQRAPRRLVMDFVLSRPNLRVGARRALMGLGYVRTMGSPR